MNRKLALLVLLLPGAARAQDIVRIESGVSGHIHPALAITKKGALIAVYCKSEYQPYLLTRSTDGGKTWSKPILFPHTVKTQVYPGSLTTLADGRVVHAWNVWFTVEGKVRSRHVAYSISSDDGLTWSAPKNLAKNADPKIESVIRHPMLEVSPTAWVVPLMDRTVVFNPETGTEAPLGDGRKHGLVPIVRTAKGALVSGKGLRSTDEGKTWQTIKPFPDVSSQGWRQQMIALKNGWLLASQTPGPGVGGDKITFILSRDDGQSWDIDHPLEFYNPGRPIGGRACPRSVEIDADHLGTIFYDIDPKQDGGSGVFFRVTPKASLGGASGLKEDEETAKDVKRFQGTWTLISIENDGRRVPPEEIRDRSLIVRGDESIFMQGKDVHSRSTQKLDASKTPKHIDVTQLLGPEKGKITRGIYAFDGDLLTICYVYPGEGRPREFSAAKGSGCILLRFRGEKR